MYRLEVVLVVAKGITIRISKDYEEKGSQVWCNKNNIILQMHVTSILPNTSCRIITKGDCLVRNLYMCVVKFLQTTSLLVSYILFLRTLNKQQYVMITQNFRANSHCDWIRLPTGRWCANAGAWPTRRPYFNSKSSCCSAGEPVIDPA